MEQQDPFYQCFLWFFGTTCKAHQRAGVTSQLEGVRHREFGKNALKVEAHLDGVGGSKYLSRSAVARDAAQLPRTPLERVHHVAQWTEYYEYAASCGVLLSPIEASLWMSIWKWPGDARNLNVSCGVARLT